MSERPVTVARAFTLGVDIEEVYIVFGEALQLMTGGLMPDHYDAVERKAQRVRDALLDHGCPHDLVQQFERVAAAIHRAGDPIVGGPEGLYHETMAATRELDAVMVGVRGQLGEDDARLYDLGIMLARLHLCLRVVTPPAGDPEGVELYRTELARVVPSSLDMLAESEAAGLLGRAMSAELEELLRRVNDELLRWDGGSDAWCRATRTRLDRVFSAAGWPTLRSPFRRRRPTSRSWTTQSGSTRPRGWRMLRSRRARSRDRPRATDTPSPPSADHAPHLRALAARLDRARRPARAASAG